MATTIVTEEWSVVTREVVRPTDGQTVYEVGWAPVSNPELAMYVFEKFDNEQDAAVAHVALVEAIKSGRVNPDSVSEIRAAAARLVR